MRTEIVFKDTTRAEFNGGAPWVNTDNQTLAIIDDESNLISQEYLLSEVDTVIFTPGA